jgi:hypothetical protein
MVERLLRMMRLGRLGRFDDRVVEAAGTLILARNRPICTFSSMSLYAAFIYNLNLTHAVLE